MENSKTILGLLCVIDNLLKEQRMRQSTWKVNPPDSVTAATLMLQAIFESMQGECEIFTRPWTSVSCEYRGDHSDEGHIQRHVKFSVVFWDGYRGRRTVCADGIAYRNGRGEWDSGEFSVALSGATLPKEYECKLPPMGQYMAREVAPKT